MSKQPLKPLNKSTKTTVKWTKSADDRLLRIERQLDNIEKRLKRILSKIRQPDQQKSKTPCSHDFWKNVSKVSVSGGSLEPKG